MPHSKSKLSRPNKKCGVLRYFGLVQNMSPKKFGFKKIWVQKNILIQKFSGSKKFLSAKYLSPQKFCASLSPSIMSVPTNYVCPHLLCLSPPIMSGKFQLERWSHEVTILCSWNHLPTQPAQRISLKSVPACKMEPQSDT